MTVLEILNAELHAMELDILVRHPDGTETRVPLLRPVELRSRGVLYVVGAHEAWPLEVRAAGCEVALVERGTQRVVA